MRRLVVLLPVVALVGGCTSFANLAGLASGAVAGGASANPAVGYAVAVGTAAAADATFKWISRRRHGAEQDAIATVAGTLGEGETAPWEIRHDIPLGNEHGEVRVVRAIASPLATCKEIVFSVLDAPDPPAHYATTLCQQGAQWKWALAEPAVERWGYLQ